MTTKNRTGQTHLTVFENNKKDANTSTASCVASTEPNQTEVEFEVLSQWVDDIESGLEKPLSAHQKMLLAKTMNGTESFVKSPLSESLRSNNIANTGSDFSNSRANDNVEWNT